MRPVIFDLDGTLVDSLPDIHAATEAMFRTLGKDPLDRTTIAGFVGNGLAKLVERCLAATGLPAERRTQALDAFRAAYAADPATLTTVYPGVEPALGALAGAGHPLAVCTNKAEDLARAVVEGTGLAPRFPVLVGGDTLPVMKPDPAPLVLAAERLGADPSAVIFVGDSDTDASAALAAGVPFLLFTRGYRRRAAEEIPATARFDSFDALPGLVAGLGD